MTQTEQRATDFASASAAGPRVLLLRMEPTGYMLALVHALRARWHGPIDAVFVHSAHTQKWSADAEREQIEFLPVGTAASIRALRLRVATQRPALFHVAGWGAPQSAAAILLARVQGVPTVVDLDTWRGAANGWRAAVKRTMLPLLLRQVTHFAPGGHPQGRYLVQYGVSDDRVTPVCMTVDVAGIRRQIAARGPKARAAFRARYAIPPESLVVLFVGRLAPEKGVDNALAAWADLQRRGRPGILVVVGDGNLRRHLDDAATKDPTIRAIGRLPASNVWEAYAAADVMIGSSPAEGWGLVVNEAMAAGLPVIVTDGYGCTFDLVRHGETGLIVQADDPAAMSDALDTLLRDEPLRMKLAANASRLISDWTIEAQADRIAHVWDRVLQRRRGVKP